jgi:hypothetical protein
MDFDSYISMALSTGVWGDQVAAYPCTYFSISALFGSDKIIKLLFKVCFKSKSNQRFVFFGFSPFLRFTLSFSLLYSSSSLWSSVSLLGFVYVATSIMARSENCLVDVSN